MSDVSFFNHDFWRQLSTTIFGTGLAFWLALLAERKATERTIHAQESSLLAATLTALVNVKGVLREIHEKLFIHPTDIVYRDPLDTALLDASATRKYDLFPVALCEQIERVRYRLLVINARLARTNSSLRLIENQRSVRSEHHVFQEFTKGEVEAALKEIDAAMALMTNASAASRN